MGVNYTAMLGDRALPNEILVAIFGYLESRSLADVARVSQRFNAVGEYVLYSLITVTDVLREDEEVPRRTVVWCSAMLRRKHLAESVRRLEIRWSSQRRPLTPVLLPICDQLSLAIRTLVGLEHLDLFLGPANFASLPWENIHAIERAVFLCSLPTLRFCSLGAEYTKGIQPYTAHITSFFAHTPALRHLRLNDHHHPFLNLPPAPHVLPLLQSFRGSAATAVSVLPGRPVQYLSLIGQDSDVSRENLFRMSHTTLPIRSLDLSAIFSRTILLRNVSDYLPTLHRLRIKLALRHTLHYALSGISLLVGLSSVLTAFPNLVCLDLSPTLENGRANPADEKILCTEYSRACPSLRTIIFPSQTEWFQDESNGNQWFMVGGPR